MCNPTDSTAGMLRHLPICGTGKSHGSHVVGWNSDVDQHRESGISDNRRNFNWQTGRYFWAFVAHLTVAWELSYCVLVWPRLTRPLVLALAVPLHLGIALFLGMITFGLVMLIGNLAFVFPLGSSGICLTKRSTEIVRGLPRRSTEPVAS